MTGLALRSSALAVLVLSAATAPAQGKLELGKMWTFENPPLAYLEKEYGFKPSQEWLDALRLASLRFGDGCSASFVSPKGLIMTNHHCVRGQIAAVSPPAEDWVKTGFYATALGEEVPIPDLTVQQLVSMRDITDQINAGITSEMPAADAAARRAENRARIEAEASAAQPELTPEIISLHQGAVYQLYLYKVFADVRLVCAPHLQIAHFGGDPDNFTYPRYSIDFAFCRAYENGAPADTAAHYFRWSSTGPIEGEVVFVTGNPGSTERLKTKAQMDFLADAAYPMVRQLIDNRLAVMRQLASDDEEQERALRPQILNYENAQKAYAGYHGGLLDERLMQAKVEAEAEFRRHVFADDGLRQRFGQLWERLEEVAAAKTALEPQRRFHTPGGSKHLARALEIVRAVRAPTAARREAHAVSAREMQVEMSAYERASFIDHLARAADWLPRSDPYRAVLLDGREPEDIAQALERGGMADAAFVDQALAQDEVALAQSDDLALRIALVLDRLVRGVERVQSWLAEQEEALGEQVGRALFAVYGNKISPDATFSLRFSDGVVRGFPFNGTIAPYRTSFYGLYARHAEFDGKYPFSLPQIWIDAAERIDMSAAVDFVSTNDIIGGNSGSGIVNRQLEVVGLVFDGNIEMLPNRFVYTDSVPRAVSVHVDAIVQALGVYGGDRILAELRGQ